MKHLDDLKQALERELEMFAKKGDISVNSLEKIHKLTDTIKNIDKICAYEESGGYSEASNWMGEGRMYGNSYDGGSSYARGRGRNARRDSMGRYSRDGGSSYDDRYSEEGYSEERGGRSGMRGGYSRDGAKDYMIEQIEEMMEEAKSPKEREALHKCMQALERA